MSVHGWTDGNASKTVYPPVSLRSLGRYNKHASIPPLSFFTGRMLFLPPNQQRQSTEGKMVSRITAVETALAVLCELFVLIFLDWFNNNICNITT